MLQLFQIWLIAISQRAFRLPRFATAFFFFAVPRRNAFKETPRAKAFWRIAPSVRLSRRAIFGAGIRFFEASFIALISADSQERRFFW